MKKVFVATGINANATPAIFKSRDIEIKEKKYIAPICALLDANISDGDEVLVIVNTPKTEWEQNTYTLMEQEVKEILTENNATGKIVLAGDGYDGTDDVLTHSVFMKDVSDLLQEGDILYADTTFGTRGDVISLLVATNYVQHAFKDFNVGTVVYASPELVDISAMFHILAITNTVRKGQKAGMDKFLNFLI